MHLPYRSTHWFGKSTSHGECDNCNRPLPVWRECGDCWEYSRLEPLEFFQVVADCGLPNHREHMLRYTCRTCRGLREIIIRD